MLFLTWFFLRNALRSKRVIWLSVLGLVPVLVALLLLALPVLTGGRSAVSSLFLEIGLTLHIHILLPLVTLLIGGGAVTEELDDNTLPYILTRPIPKWRYALSKIIAGCITAGIILIVSLCAAYTVMKGASGIGTWLSGLPGLLQAAGVLCLGILAYIGFFGLLGALVKRPVLAGLVFAFGWEKIIAHLPSRMQLLTIVKYLNSLYPNYREPGGGGDIAALMKRILQSQGTSPQAPALALLLIFAVCAAATSILLYVREYRRIQ
jgi:ABC-2 type transport system permease protein